MALRIILIALLIVLVLAVIVPFVLNMVGVRILQGGFVGGGGGTGLLIRSTDGGKNWAEVTVSEEKTRRFPTTILDFSFHPTDSDTLYVGTRGSGAWVSINGGASWSPITDGRHILRSDADVYRIAVSASDVKTMYLVVYQEDRGRVLQSEDGGLSFHEVYEPGSDRVAVADIYVDPQDREHILIATGQGGILESHEGGKTWRARQWFPHGIVRLLVSGVSHDLYVLTARGKFFKSTDSGENWSEFTIALRQPVSEVTAPVPAAPSINPLLLFRSRLPNAVILDPRRPTTLYVASLQGLLRSADGGVSWSRLNLLLPPDTLAVDAVAIHPDNSDIIFATAANQLHRSDDGGVHWTIDSFPARSQITTLLIHPLRPEMMFAVLGR